MASTFELSSYTYDGRKLVLTCRQYKNEAENKSTINWTLTATGGNANYYSTGATTVRIAGHQVYYKERVSWESKTFPAAAGSTGGTITVNHSQTGGATISVSLSTAIYATDVRTWSGNWTLDTIPRQANLLGFEWANDEANPRITWQNYAESNVDKLELFLMPKDTAEILASRVITNYGSWVNYELQLTDAERKSIWRIYNVNKNTKTSFKVILRTTIGSMVKDDEYELLNVPMINNAPLVNLSLTMDEKTKSLVSKPIINFTYLTFNVEATGVKDATITDYYYRNPPFSAHQKTGSHLCETSYFMYSATDNRGTITEHDGVIDVIDYKALTCNQKVNIELEGENQARVSIDITGTYYQGMLETHPNALMLYFRYCEENENIEDVEWEYIGTHQTYSNYEYKTTHNLPTLLDYQKTYKFQCSAQDLLLTKTTTVYTAKIKPVFDWSGSDFNFNVPVSMYGVEQDYIVEQGTKDGWTYRKWNSGIGECWKTISYTTTVTGAWGGLYQSGYIARQNYPFAFVEKPVENVSCVAGGGGGWICPADAANGGTNGAYASAVYIIIRPTAATNYQTYYVNYQIIGKWK